MKKLVLIGLVSAVLAGCSVHKDLVATGGSKADGTVELSLEHSPFEKPVVSEAQGLELAKKRCSAWGYKNAEKFGGQKRVCNQFGFGGCDRFLVTIQYQCLDK
ncbi:YecR family lipoprotein [Avibacterium avium]|uniref:YecR family lipoprotein n=1 Tax=Avibacterium avium TaxID=751 RepID=UPI003BF8E802